MKSGKELGESSLDKVVGGTPELASEAHRGAARLFSKVEFSDLKDAEREPSPEELRIFALADEATDRMREHYGLEPFPIPAKNIHIIKKEKWWGDPEVSGEHKPIKQASLLVEQETRSKTLSIAMHELIHAKSYFSINIDDGKNTELRRFGLETRVRSGQKLFTPLNEAVTEELNIRLKREALRDPLFDDEAKESALMRKRHGPGGKSPDDVFNEDVYLARRVPLDGTDGYRLQVAKHAYPKERGALNMLIDKLYARNKDDFKDREEIFGLFAGAMLGGKLLVLGRIMKKTFGEDALRTLGSMGDADSFARFVERL